MTPLSREDLAAKLDNFAREILADMQLMPPDALEEEVFVALKNACLQLLGGASYLLIPK